MTEQLAIPHSKEAEESIIGAVLLDSEWLDYISLDPEDFFIHRYRFIWGAIQEVRSSGLAVDYVTVTNELELRKQLNEIGGSGALYDLMNKARDTDDNIESHAEVVKQMSANRSHIEIAKQIVKQAMNGGVDVANVIESLNVSSKGVRDGRPIGEGLGELYDNVMERMKNPVDIWGIPTGFMDLDKRTGGFHKQQVFYLSGESGTGKTTLMLQCALAAARAGYGVAIFEKEMDEQRTLRRLIELESGIPNRAMVTGKMELHSATFIHAVEKMKDLPIYINDDPISTTAEIRSVIARERVRMPIDIIFLDYLGLLGDETKGRENDWDQIKAVRFRELCRQMDLAGFAIQDMKKFEGAPTMQDMSGGSKVRFGADWIFIIVQDDENKKLHWLLPAKQRDGDQGSKPIPLNRIGLGFKDSAPEIVHL